MSDPPLNRWFLEPLAFAVLAVATLVAAVVGLPLLGLLRVVVWLDDRSLNV